MEKDGEKNERWGRGRGENDCAGAGGRVTEERKVGKRGSWRRDGRGWRAKRGRKAGEEKDRKAGEGREEKEGREERRRGEGRRGAAPARRVTRANYDYAVSCVTL